MMERIINEFRVIETDDGFRIEIKGDKEKIKSFMSGFGKHKGGPHGRARRWGAAFGPFGFHFGPGMWMKAASCCGMWDLDEEEEAEEASQT
jgi:hypothetical protein